MENIMLVIGLVILLFGLSAATKVQPCNGIPLPLSVEVENCEDPPCTVYKGSTTIMEVLFLGTKNDINTITAKASAKVLGMNIPYQLSDDISNVCANLMYGAICPIYKDEDVTYKMNFYADPTFPDITADVTTILYDDDDEPVTCFICSFKVRKAI